MLFVVKKETLHLILHVFCAETINITFNIPCYLW